MKYVSKPVKIKAVQLTKLTITHDVPKLLGESKNYPECKNGGIDPATGKFMLKTAHGDVVCEYGNYIIKGEKDFYPCDPTTFKKKYKKLK